MTDPNGSTTPAAPTPAAATTPFAIQHSPQLPELLAEIECSLALTTYQAGKVIVLSSDGERLIQLPRTFEEPMGLAVEGDRMAVATKDSLVLLANDSRLASTYPRQPEIYDALFVPRSVHFTGALAVHDMVWTPKGLLGVNTLFSCLFQLDSRFSFRPVWKPPFISGLAPEDRCHLNGLAVVGGEPRFATALGVTDTPGGWREQKERGGVLMHVPSGEVVLGGLAMPHSPRVYDGTLYALISATGEVISVDVERGEFEVVNRVPGFARGMARHGDYLFVATSTIRKRHIFGDLGLAGRNDTFCGISVLHLPTGALVGDIRYLRTCEEIYDVQVLAGLKRPGLLGIHDETYKKALSIPDQTFWARPPEDA
jgi:uncharacterized protein (TIGR03032 family)